MSTTTLIGVMPNMTIQRLLSAVWKPVFIALIASILYKWIVRPTKNNLFPVWATVEVAVATLIMSNGWIWPRKIYSSIRRYDGSLFGLTSRHQVLVNLPGVDRLMSQSYHTINAEPVQYTLFTRVFGADDSTQLERKLEVSWKDLLKPIEDMFLNENAVTAAILRGNVPDMTASFISFSDQEDRMQRWERSADIRLLNSGPGQKPKAVEANFQSLVRDFGASFAIPLLYGHDFFNRYPQLLDDFWRFDNDVFPLLMIGLPPWAPFKVMREGVAARSRILSEIEALYRRIDQYQRGEAVESGADMSDVSAAAFARNKVYDRERWSFRERGGGDLAILWGQNANTQAILFWFLTYVYSTSGMKDRLRAEIEPHIRLTTGDEPKIASMDLSALFANCPLLKASIFETYRMTDEAASIRYVAKPITVVDGELKHELQPGMFVTVPHSVSQRDPSVYANPEQFTPDRFLESDASSGKVFARYGRLRPWGTGAAMCKGRTFAEREIMALGAAILCLWDVEPAEGRWKLPTMLPGTGVKKPTNDIRVIITHRSNLS